MASIKDMYLNPMRRFSMVSISAPSGSGKTTLINKLVNTCPKFEFSISATTREPRGEEKDMKDYYFMTIPQFEKKVVRGDFLEWEMVYNNVYYGTLKSEITRIKDNGNIPILDVDVKTALRLKRKYPNDIYTVFVKCPSMAELEKRLRDRKTDSDFAIRERLMKASAELGYEDEFDNIVVNGNVEDAFDDLSSSVWDAVNYY